MSPSQGPDGSQSSFERVLPWAILALAAIIAAARLRGVFTENVNWDEFALLQRGEELARVGQLRGSGRPGLANFLVAPFAEACRNAVDALVRARILWTGFVVAALGGFWLLLRGVLPASRDRFLALATGLALWALAPSFLRYSVQVRTDQLALLGGLWGGVALLASRVRPGWAFIAGVVVAGGFLASQKLVYVLGLVMILVGAYHLTRGDFRWRREAFRLGLLAAGLVLGVAGFEVLTAGLRSAPTDFAPVAGQLSVFEYYRERSGFWWYLWMWPGLLAQSLVVVFLVVVSVDWLRGDRGERRDGGLILAGWVALAALVVVIGFHAGRFPYFYMVLGLFPAAIGGLTLPPLLSRVESGATRAGVLALLWIPMAWSGLSEAVAMVRDDVAHQRESLDFVEAAFSPEARGFSDVAVFACRHDPDPFPTRFGMSVRADFFGPDSVANTQGLLEQFRVRPVSFMVPVQFPDRYPQAVQDFWEAHYVRYYRQVHLPGQRVEGGGATVRFSAVRPGSYRWWPDDGESAIRVGARHVHAGEVVELIDTSMTALTTTDSAGGVFALDVPLPPRPDTTQFFTLFLERRERTAFPPLSPEGG